MRIIFATPLYPPDVAWPAPYIKELAARLSPADAITVVTYGHLPEQIAGVDIVAVDKRAPLPWRLMRYTRALWRAASKADIIYAENGASVELPLVIVSFLSRTPILLHIGDERAHKRASESVLLSSIHKAALSSAKKVMTGSPLPRPEILPLEEYPTNALAAYEASWHKHLEELEDLFDYARE